MGNESIKVIFDNYICDSCLVHLNKLVYLAADILPFAKLNYPSTADVKVLINGTILKIKAEVRYFSFRGKWVALLLGKWRFESAQMNIIYKHRHCVLMRCLNFLIFCRMLLHSNRVMCL